MDAADDTLDQRLAAMMAAAQAGDGRAYETLLRACAPIIASVGARFGLSGALLEDTVQETLITIHAARRTYDPARPFLPWLRALARHRAIDAARRRGRTERREIHAPLAVAQAIDQARQADEMVVTDDAARRLRALVDRLPPGQRQAVEQLALAERSLEETAMITGRSKVALKVNLHRAIASMRARLRGGADE
jgi:RNA polymerase sigma-70 factor (ECF subfamily)